jgi:hypothetical protein
VRFEYLASLGRIKMPLVRIQSLGPIRKALKFLGLQGSSGLLLLQPSAVIELLLAQVNDI